MRGILLIRSSSQTDRRPWCLNSFPAPGVDLKNRESSELSESLESVERREDRDWNPLVTRCCGTSRNAIAQRGDFPLVFKTPRVPDQDREVSNGSTHFMSLPARFLKPYLQGSNVTTRRRNNFGGLPAVTFAETVVIPAAGADGSGITTVTPLEVAPAACQLMRSSDHW